MDVLMNIQIKDDMFHIFMTSPKHDEQTVKRFKINKKNIR